MPCPRENRHLNTKLGCLCLENFISTKIVHCNLTCIFKDREGDSLLLKAFYEEDYFFLVFAPPSFSSFFLLGDKNPVTQATAAKKKP